MAALLVERGADASEWPFGSAGEFVVCEPYAFHERRAMSWRKLPNESSPRSVSSQ